MSGTSFDDIEDCFNSRDLIPCDGVGLPRLSAPVDLFDGAGFGLADGNGATVWFKLSSPVLFNDLSLSSELSASSPSSLIFKPKETDSGGKSSTEKLDNNELFANVDKITAWTYWDLNETKQKLN